MNRKYVGIRACLNLNVSLLGTRGAMKPSQLYTRLLCKYTTMTMTHGSALVLMLVEHMEWNHVGFGRTECTLLLVHV